MQVSDDETGENCPAEGAIHLQVCPGRVTIRYGTSDREYDRPVKYQDEGEQNEQTPPNQPGPSPTPLRKVLAAFIHEGGNLFPRG
jgi:hypothetical protein